MNDEVIERFARRNREKPITVFRGRPYHSNDQSYVEQKNYTHVRMTFGYDRIDFQLAVQLMNGVYRKEWRLLQNHFYPQMKLLKKVREGSRIRRTMSKPVTPTDRLMAGNSITEDDKARLTAEASCVSKRVTLECKIAVITENHRALDVGLAWRPEREIILANHHKSQNISEVTPVSAQAVRRYLKRLLGRMNKPAFQRGKGKSVNSYKETAKRLLKELWKDMGYLGSVRMKGAIPGWIDKWQHPDLDDYSRFELLEMSISTIERTLKEEKAKLRRRLNTGTKSGGHKLKKTIPIRNLENRPQMPGHCEIDCVAHCGGSLSGEHIWTLTLTDIVTGHTENEALQFKNGWEFKLALDRIADRLPFPLIALYMDNGPEFLNDDVHKRFSAKKNQIDREELIKLFRSQSLRGFC
jgi:hypothetical protein